MALILRSVELSIAVAPKAPTWRTSCRCFITDSLSRGTRDSCSGFGWRGTQW
jgi:hypothetical protein